MSAKLNFDRADKIMTHFKKIKLSKNLGYTKMAITKIALINCYLKKDSEKFRWFWT